MLSLPFLFLMSAIGFRHTFCSKIVNLCFTIFVLLMLLLRLSCTAVPNQLWNACNEVVEPRWRRLQFKPRRCAHSKFRPHLTPLLFQKRLLLFTKILSASQRQQSCFYRSCFAVFPKKNVEKLSLGLENCPTFKNRNSHGRNRGHFFNKYYFLY